MSDLLDLRPIVHLAVLPGLLLEAVLLGDGAALVLVLVLVNNLVDEDFCGAAPTFLGVELLVVESEGDPVVPPPLTKVAIFGPG